MAGFNAATVVEPLDWDFNPYATAKGRIKEPTDDQIAQFLNALKAMTEEVKGSLPDGTDTADPAEVIAAIDSLDASAVVDAHRKMAVIFSALCSGDPSPETLLQLPMRIRTVFFGWLQQELMSPEAAPGGGSAQVTTLRPAAAG